MSKTTSDRRAPRDEREFLELQAARALAGLRREARGMARDARAAVSLSGWTREHPWILLGTSAVASFGAGLGLAASWSKRRSSPPAEGRKKEKIEEPLAARPPVPGPKQAQAAGGGSSIVRAVVHVLGPLATAGIKLAPMIYSQLSSAGSGHRDKPSLNGKDAGDIPANVELPREAPVLGPP